VAVDQYFEGTPKGNESCVENCDKALELILKAKVNDTGQSIYFKVGDPRTIDIKEAVRRLTKQNIAIPEQKKLLKIHVRRNPTHHMGETVSRARTKSILKTTMEFIGRFLRDEYNLELKDVLKPRYYYEVLNHVITKKQPAVMMTDEAHTQLNRLDQDRSTIPKEYDYIEILLNWLAKKKKLKLQRQRQKPSLSNKSSNNNRSLHMSEIVNALIKNGTLPEERRKDFDIIIKLYDKVVNTQEEITWDNGYDEYTTAILRFKSHLELIQQAER
jgi:hypothetical protein